MNAWLAFTIWTLGAMAIGAVIGSLLERRLQTRERALLKDDVAFWRGKADEWQRLAEEERKQVEVWMKTATDAQDGWRRAIDGLNKSTESQLRLVAAVAARPVKPKSTDVN